MNDSKKLENDSTALAGNELDHLWYHMKTGGIYRIITDNAKYEDQGPSSRAVVYQSLKDGTIWIRPYQEFMDGRFRGVNFILSEHHKVREYAEIAKKRLDEGKPVS